MKIIPIFIEAGISAFESPAADNILHALYQLFLIVFVWMASTFIVAA
jgi:hypothetical protein